MTDLQIWTIAIVVGLGTFLIRFSFLGLVGKRPMPPFALRLLRYTPVAVLPAMVAPLVVWPAATQGVTDPLRIVAALVTVAVGVTTRKFMPAILSGAGVLLVGMGLTALL